MTTALSSAASSASANPGAPEMLVDLARYPLLDLDGPAAQGVLSRAREQLAEIGAAELTGFLRPEGLALAARDAAAMASSAYRSVGAATPYLEIPDFSLPEDHPRRIFGEASVGVIAYDQFSPASPLLRLYHWQPLMSFIGAILQRGPLHRYACPLGALNLAVMTEGDKLQWHFDQTDFVVSLALQDADEGGDFEVAPRIRSAEDECYDDVRRVLRGERELVLRLPMQPGTLLIFEGRHSVHRVSEIHGNTPRLVALLAYDTKPGTVSSEVLRLGRYGRVG